MQASLSFAQRGLVRHCRGWTGCPYTLEEEPKWDKDFGAILIGENGAPLARADPREETTALGK